MRAWLLALAACGGGVNEIKDTPPPTPQASCKVAGQKLIELVVAAQNEPPPDEAVNHLIGIVENRCTTDGWSADALRCFSKVKTVGDADTCSKTLTDPQLQALGSAMQPPDGAAPAKGATDGAALPPPPPPPPPATRGADPCDGGE